MIMQRKKRIILKVFSLYRNNVYMPNANYDGIRKMGIIDWLTHR